MAEPTAKPTPGALLALLALSAAVGIVVSFAAWGFLEATHQIQVGVFQELPGTLGFSNTPVWWPVPILAIAGVVVALAITRLPGRGGHDPTSGLGSAPTAARDLPGVMLAAIATIGLGAVLGPEAPLIALGTGLGMLAIGLLRRDAPEPVHALIAASGGFAAISLVFGSPLIAAVLLIEASALDRRGLTVVLPVGLLAAGVGSLVSVGIGAWTGLSSADYALGSLTLPALERPDVAEIAWTAPLAIAIAAGTFAIFRLARVLQPVVFRRPLLLVPAAGVAIAGLAIVFDLTTDHPQSDVLFSGQDALPGLVEQAGTWSTGALVMLLVLKGLAWSVSLAGFRGGPTFPALFVGAAAGILASHLPGLSTTPAVAVGMGAATVAVLRLPLAAVVLATLLTSQAGPGAQPLIVVSVVAAFVTTLALDRFTAADAEPGTAPAGPPAAPGPAAAVGT